MMQHLSRALVAVTAVVWAVAPVALGDTSALETLAFYGASTIQVRTVPDEKCCILAIFLTATPGYVAVMRMCPARSLRRCIQL